FFSSSGSFKAFVGEGSARPSDRARSAVLYSGARFRRGRGNATTDHMKRFLGLPRSHILFDIASRAYEHAPQPLAAAYQYTAPIRQVYKDRRVPVKLVHGLIRSGRRASLLVAGAGQSIDYMLGRFFTQPLHGETVGDISLVDVIPTLRRLHASADMTIAQLPRLLSRWLGGNEYLHVPPWIGTHLLVPE